MCACMFVVMGRESALKRDVTALKCPTRCEQPDECALLILQAPPLLPPRSALPGPPQAGGALSCALRLAPATPARGAPAWPRAFGDVGTDLVACWH